MLVLKYTITSRDVSSVNRTKYNTGKKLENFIHWRYYKDHGKKLVLILLDYYYN